MKKTAAENQAAYRQRKADKLSEESTEVGSTLSPGADCVPDEDTGKEEINLTNPVVPGDDPGIFGLPPDRVLEKLDELLSLVREINQHIAHPSYVVPIEKPWKSTLEVTPTKPTPKPVGDLTQCMRCAVKLPPTETPRMVQELCHDCVWRN